MRITKIFTGAFIFTALLFGNTKLLAQDKRYIPLGHTKYKDTLLVAHPDTTFEKDLFDVIKLIFDKNYKQGKADSNHQAGDIYCARGRVHFANLPGRHAIRQCGFSHSSQHPHINNYR